MEKVLGSCKKGSLFIISAPAGTGKTTLVGKLLSEFPDSVAESCSYTTREPREDEKEGVHYHFISKSEFEERISRGEFLEYATLYGHYYGTARSEVERLLNLGKHVLLVIDTQGALQLKGKIEGVYIFISPPSVDELARRLLSRRSENESELKERLAWAEKELVMAKHYDYHFVNDEMNVAYQVLRSILIAEEHKTKRAYVN
jgi:guanylate kinase